MRKLVFGLIAGAMLTWAPASSAQLVTVEDPTPTGSFSGSYACYEYTAETATDPGEYTADGTFVGTATGTHNRVDSTCGQTGYVSVGTEGVVACNGNEEITRPDDGSPLQGYVWIGPDLAASNPTAASPGNIIGAGNNHEDADGNATGDSPCP